MSGRFYRRKKLLPGVYINCSKSGPSISLGPRGARFTVGPRGTRETVGIPGTGVSYTTTRRSLLWPSLALLIVAATIAIAFVIAIAVVNGWQ
jgi:hypothetical protein